MEFVVAHQSNVLLFYFQLRRFNDRLLDSVDGDFKLESTDSLQVKFNAQVTPLRRVYLFNIFSNVAKLCFFNTTFDYSSTNCRLLVD